jgi:hypothetical protein
MVSEDGGLETGVVEVITLGYTILRTGDNRRIVVPNSVMANQLTVNLTCRYPRIIVAIPVRISYAADLEKARGILVKVALRRKPQDAVASILRGLLSEGPWDGRGSGLAPAAFCGRRLGIRRP